MTIEEKMKKIKNYFENFIDKRLIKDILLIKEENASKFAYPYLILASALIDTMGGIEEGFRNSESGLRSKKFMENWMSKIKPLYKNNDVKELFYNSLRSGVIHQASVGKGFIANSSEELKEKHLHLIENEDKILFHTIVFAEDVIKSCDLFKENILNNKDTESIEKIYNNIFSMFDDNRNNRYEQNLINLKLFLKEENRIYNSTKYKEIPQPSEPPDVNNC